MDEDDDTINSSPTPIRASTSRRSIRLRLKSTYTVEIKEELDKTLGGEKQCDSRDVNLFEVDRLDCLRAQQEPRRVRAVPASENFMSLQSMLESQQFPKDKAESEVWHSPEISLEAPSPPKTIVDAILLDFCGSSSYVEEDEVPSHDFPPWFRFRNKRIRTYSRRRLSPKLSPPQPISPNIIIEDDDERMSCSSGLSVQEDLITQMPTTTHCNFDANSSQMICENLQNLSAFFNQTNANSSIDLPANLQIKSEEIDDLQDATDILDDNGYLIGNTEECRLQYEICDSKIMQRAELTLFNESTRPPAAADTAICKVETLDTNVCDDWFDGDMNTEMISVTNEEKREIVEDRINTKDISDIDLLDGIPFSEWQPIDIPSCSLSDSKVETIANVPECVEFRTASNKQIEVSEEKQIQAAQLMADLESKQPSDDLNQMEFRTASNKAVILTEDMRKKAAMLMADLECGTATDEDQSNQFKGFHTAANRIIQVTEQMQRAGANLLADLEINRTKEEELLDEIPLSEWQPIEIETVQQQQPAMHFQAICSQLDMMPLDTVEPVAFRTASNKAIEITEEQQQLAARLMADLDANYSQTTKETSERISHLPAASNQIQFRDDLNQMEFRTASNKTVILTDDMRKKAAMLMADLECGTATDEDQSNQFKGFHTAANKTIQVTEQMQRAGANLMADLEINRTKEEELLDEIPLSEWQPIEIETVQQQQPAMDFQAICSQLEMMPLDTVEPVAFRTASNKAIEITEEQQQLAAGLMADLDANYSQTTKETSERIRHLPAPSQQIQFRTASNKVMELSEEMQRKAAMLMADLESTFIPPKDCAKSFTESVASGKIQFRTASNKVMELSEEMQRKAEMLMSDLESTSIPPKDCAKSFTESVASGKIHFRTASNKAMELSEEMQKKAAMLMADLEPISVPPQSPKESCFKNFTDTVASENILFRTESNKVMELSEEIPKKTAMLMADLEPISISPKKEETAATLLLEDITNEAPELLEGKAEILVKPRKTGKQSKLIPCETSVLANNSPATLVNAFDTPKSTPDMQVSLTQLSERSPLDNVTKTSIITRRNLLSLNKRRKLMRDSENCNVDTPPGQTPMRQHCAPMTSTPVPSSSNQRQLRRDSRRDRSCSLESPSVQRERVGKRRSEEALSPIYAPTNKTRRLGLSRTRNKSSNDI